MATLTTVEQAISKGVTVGDQGPIVLDIRTKLEKFFPALQSVANPQLYDSELAGRVAKFQSSKGLAADGVVGPNTWAALGGTVAAAPPPPAAAPPATTGNADTGDSGYGLPAKLAIGGAIALGVWWASRKFMGRGSPLPAMPEVPSLSEIFSYGEDEEEKRRAAREKAKAKRKAQEQREARIKMLEAQLVARRAASTPAAIAEQADIDARAAALVRSGMSPMEAQLRVRGDRTYQHNHEDYTSRTKGVMARTRADLVERELQGGMVVEGDDDESLDRAAQQRALIEQRGARLLQVNRAGAGLPGNMNTTGPTVMRKNSGGGKPYITPTARISPVGGKRTPPMVLFVDPFRWESDRNYREDMKQQAKTDAVLGETVVTIKVAPDRERDWMSGGYHKPTVLWSYKWDRKLRTSGQSADSSTIAAERAHRNAIAARYQTKTTAEDGSIIDLDYDEPEPDEPKKPMSDLGDVVSTRLIRDMGVAAQKGDCGSAAVLLSRVEALPASLAHPRGSREHAYFTRVRSVVLQRCGKEVRDRNETIRAMVPPASPLLVAGSDVARDGGALTLQRLRQIEQASGAQKRRAKAEEEAGRVIPLTDKEIAALKWEQAKRVERISARRDLFARGAAHASDPISEEALVAAYEREEFDRQLEAGRSKSRGKGGRPESRAQVLWRKPDGTYVKVTRSLEADKSKKGWVEMAVAPGMTPEALVQDVRGRAGVEAVEVVTKPNGDKALRIKGGFRVRTVSKTLTDTEAGLIAAANERVMQAEARRAAQRSPVVRRFTPRTVTPQALAPRPPPRRGARRVVVVPPEWYEKD